MVLCAPYFRKIRQLCVRNSVPERQPKAAPAWVGAREDGARGLNFLTPQIFEVAKRRMAEKTGTVTVPIPHGRRRHGPAWPRSATTNFGATTSWP